MHTNQVERFPQVRKRSRALLLGVAISLVLGPLLAAGDDKKDEKKDEKKPIVIYQAPKKGQENKPQPLSAAVQVMQAANTAIQKEQWDEALAELRKAQSLPLKTPQEDYQIDEMLAFAQTRKGDYAGAAETFQRTIESSFFPAEQMGERLRLLMQLNYEIKQYDKAIEYGKKIFAADDKPDPAIRSLLGRAYYLAGEHRDAAATMTRAIEDARSVGKPIEEAWLQVKLSSYVELRDNAGIASALEQLAVSFPRKKYWEDFFRINKRQADADPRMLMNLYRLMFDTGMMQGVDDYVQTGRIAMRMGLPGEAVAVLEQGKARKVFVGEDDVERGRQLLQEAQAAAVADRKTLVASEQEAKAAKNGEADVQLGIAYMGYGQFEKAIEAIERGQKKGGLKYPGEADLMLGRALFKLDRKPDAMAAFERVVSAGGAADSLRGQLGVLANLWLVYLRQPAVVTT